MKHIASMAAIAAIGCTNAFALDEQECVRTAEAAKYVAVQRDNGTPELVTVFKARNRFNIVNEVALHNMVQSVYSSAQYSPATIYRHTLNECAQLLTNGSVY